MGGVVQRATEPFELANRLRLSNRLVGTAHGAGLVSDGLAQSADAEYWRRRAAGGAAMLIVGGTVTAPESTWRRRIVTEAWRDDALPGMALRAEAIRAEGAVAACQLVHLGRETTGAEMWFAPVAPSAVRSPREPVRARVLTEDDVDEIVEGFRVSAVNAAQAGFQVVELHAAHGYLLAQFLSPMSNLRADADSPAGRARIVSRIVEAIRETAPELLVGIRVSAEGGDEAGHTLDGLCELLPHIARLVDYVNLTVGVRTTYVKDMGTEEPPLLGAIDRLRPLVERPMLVSQAFRRGSEVERALAAGADLVGIARPLIADPDFPAKLLSGRESQIRPCVSCNEDCRAFDPVLLCSVNPELAPPGMTRRPAIPLLAQRGRGEGDARVAIVGAGPAGLECAVSLAGRGEVVLFDERPAIGGQLAIAAAAPHRHGWRALLHFYESALEATPGLTVRLGVRATAAELDGFDDVVIAAGSDEVLPSLPGIDRAVSASDAIDARIAPGPNLLIVDDGFGSWLCASAVELGVEAEAQRITVVTPGAAFGAALPAEGRTQLLARLQGAPLDVRPLTALEAISGSGAEVRNLLSRQTETIAVDTVIVVGERRARDWRALLPPDATVRVIGDAQVPRRVAHAISEGRAAAEAIEHERSRNEIKASA
jgi:2,4-dienoyl-CoA reductase (NADPH2)